MLQQRMALVRRTPRANAANWRSRPPAVSATDHRNKQPSRPPGHSQQQEKRVVREIWETKTAKSKFIMSFFLCSENATKAEGSQRKKEKPDIFITKKSPENMKCEFVSGAHPDYETLSSWT
ncbi:hypothetical protein niasHT_029688 [Heterodera trifolii]|uniref:Uncharacterized protein n=1 Tax=Heterodera trifolii TaxID=157864 RepID=A0ABD2KSZ2_9BILA